MATCSKTFLQKFYLCLIVWTKFNISNWHTEAISDGIVAEIHYLVLFWNVDINVLILLLSLLNRTNEVPVTCNTIPWCITSAAVALSNYWRFWMRISCDGDMKFRLLTVQYTLKYSKTFLIYAFCTYCIGWVPHKYSIINTIEFLFFQLIPMSGDSVELSYYPSTWRSSAQGHQSFKNVLWP